MWPYKQAVLDLINGQFLQTSEGIWPYFLYKNVTNLGEVGGDGPLLELVLVNGVEMAEWFGEVFGVLIDDHENRVDRDPAEWDELRPRPIPTSVWVELLRWGWIL